MSAVYVSVFLVPALMGYFLARELSLVFNVPKWLGQG